MATKDVLWKGKWTYPDGRVLNVTDADLDNAAAQGNAMIAAGLVVPWCWDHQPGATPAPVEMSMSVLADPNVRAKVARNTIPLTTTAYRVEEKADAKGVRRRVLVAVFDDGKLSDDEKNRVKAAGRVSCRVARNLWDPRGDGRKFSGLVVQHVAVTPSAIEPDQGDFQMSLAAMPELARGKCDEYWDMAFGKGDDEPDGDEPGDYPVTADPDLTADEPGPVLPPPPPPAAPVPLGPPPEMGDIMASLALMGLPLPADQITTLPQLAMALKIAAGLGGQLKGSPTAGDPDADLTATVGAGASPPMLMSQSAMLARAPNKVAVDRSELKAKIGRLHKRGKIPGPTYDLLVQDFDSFEMSYTASGRARGELITVVKVLDRYLPEGFVLRRSQGDTYDMAVSGLDPATVGEVPPPAVYREAGGMASLETLMEGAYARFGLPKEKPSAAPAA